MPKLLRKQQRPIKLLPTHEAVRRMLDRLTQEELSRQRGVEALLQAFEMDELDRMINQLRDTTVGKLRSFPIRRRREFLKRAPANMEPVLKQQVDEIFRRRIRPEHESFGQVAPERRKRSEIGI